ncbi:MAG: hypothetical protein K8S56_07830, partial [Candidatus Cloacimonetes bacterium]|nr:hypothetical protein [Candidatus Cloacimonadota bacterium]
KVPVETTETIKVPKEVKRAQYTPVGRELFPDADKPVPLAILGFLKNNEEDESLSSRFAIELKNVPDIYSKFKIYDPRSLKESLELRTLDSQDARLLKQLSDTMKINYIVFGRISNVIDRSFEMTVKRLSDNVIVFHGNYENSDKSTAIIDAVKLFSNNQIPQYSMVHVGEDTEYKKITVHQNRRIAYQTRQLDIFKTLAIIALAGVGVFIALQQ